MSGRVSPFAELTGAERQIKWLEYQSIRLPYVQGNVDEDLWEEEQAQPAPPAPEPAKSSAPERARPAERPDASTSEKGPTLRFGSEAQASFQKVRHRQYDAVIARMKQAELRVGGSVPFSQLP